MHIHVDLIIRQRLKLLALTGQACMGVEHINACAQMPNVLTHKMFTC